jgi:hypothetical protein
MVHRLSVVGLHTHPRIQMGKVLAILILQKQLAGQVRGKNVLFRNQCLGYGYQPNQSLPEHSSLRSTSSHCIVHPGEDSEDPFVNQPDTMPANSRLVQKSSAAANNIANHKVVLRQESISHSFTGVVLSLRCNMRLLKPPTMRSKDATMNRSALALGNRLTNIRLRVFRIKLPQMRLVVKRHDGDDVVVEVVYRPGENHGGSLRHCWWEGDSERV